MQMRYVLLGLLAIVLPAVGLLTLGLWHAWELYLHLKDGRLSLTLHIFGMRRKILDRELAPNREAGGEKPSAAEAQPSSSVQGNAESKKRKSTKPKRENRFTERFKRDKKRIYDKENGGYQPGGIGELIEEYKEIWDEIQRACGGFLDGIRYKIEIRGTEIWLDLGTGNPAHTGMAYGAIWGALGLVYPLICRYIRMEYPKLQITPDFYEKRFELEIKSIIKVRPAHIINALIKQGWYMAATYLRKKYQKGSGSND